MIFLAFSGGLDSSTLLAKLHEEKGPHEIMPVFFNYGSKHNPYEYQSATAVAEHYGYGPRLTTIDLSPSGIYTTGASALLSGSERAIPSSAYAEPGSLAATLVPGRNLIMAAVLAAMAEAEVLKSRNSEATPQPLSGDEPNLIALAVHGGDHPLYPDCRPDFIRSLSNTIDTSSEGRVSLIAPFLTMDKTEIVRLGLQMGVPYRLTRSCYQESEAACGLCGTCRERREAFRANNAQDPACAHQDPL